MRNHEVTKVQRLLNEDGTLKEPGWSRKLYQIYDRNDIKKRATRIKEWDYYLVLAKDYGVAFTISDDGYIGLQSVSLLDFRGTPWEHTETVLSAFPMGKLKMPSTTDKGDVMYKDKRLYLEYKKRGNMRKIVCVFKNFHEGKTFTCDLTLTQPDGDTMVIATPWKEDKHAFYYNQKINCMRASGTCTYGSETYTFNSDTDFATLDWGRGVWTYDNTWNWGSGNGIINGKDFGFNIGYGFGDTTAASENIIFYDGVGHKLDDITFNIPEDSYTKPWTITSSDKRFEMTFTPIIDRAAKIDVKLIVTDQHQVFGKMNGVAVLDDGTKLEVKDLVCFCERVHNKY
ncbi:MAG: DUF2804 domain-containing protein [Ruminococcus sp.]|nr:DUF2804 domain-containing protein [Ruminococcus sp.]MDD7343919.1 DUF2804 domain-containing protein [Ruminococcus sp.]MDY4909186.1 DUF2804 domain-containing protein [Candidatus Fimenecus sp.]